MLFNISVQIWDLCFDVMCCNVTPEKKTREWCECQMTHRKLENSTIVKYATGKGRRTCLTVVHFPAECTLELERQPKVVVYEGNEMGIAVRLRLSPLDTHGEQRGSSS